MKNGVLELQIRNVLAKPGVKLLKNTVDPKCSEAEMENFSLVKDGPTGAST